MIKHDTETDRYILKLVIEGDDSRLKAIEMLTWLVAAGYGDRTLDSTISDRRITLADVLDSLKNNENLKMNYHLELRFSKLDDAAYMMLRWA